MAANLKVIIDVDAKGQVKIKQFGKALDNVSLRASTLGKKMVEVAAGIGRVGAAIAVAGAAVAAWKAVDFAKSVINTSMAFEKLDLSLAAAAGSVQAGADAFAFLRSETDRLGVVFEDNVKYFMLMTAAAKGTKLEGQGVRDVWLSIVEAGIVVGATNEELSRTFLQLQQGISKGKFELVDLKMIMEALPGVGLQDFANAMGVTTAEFLKMVSAGEVLADVFLPKLVVALRDKFGASVEKASKTVQADINRIINAWTEFKLAVGETGFYRTVGDGIKSLVTSIRSLKESGGFNDFAKSIGGAMTSAAQSVASMVKTLYANRAEISDFFSTVGEYASNLVDIFGPVFKTISGFVVDIAKLVLRYENIIIDSWKKIGNAAIEVGRTITSSFEKIQGAASTAYDGAKGVISGWVKQFKKFTDAIGGDFGKTAEMYEKNMSGKFIKINQDAYKSFMEVGESVDSVTGPVESVSHAMVTAADGTLLFAESIYGVGTAAADTSDNIGELEASTKMWAEMAAEAVQTSEQMASEALKNIRDGITSTDEAASIDVDFTGSDGSTTDGLSATSRNIRQSLEDTRAAISDRSVNIQFESDGKSVSETLAGMGNMWRSMSDEVKLNLDASGALKRMKETMDFYHESLENAKRHADKFYEWYYRQAASATAIAFKKAAFWESLGRGDNGFKSMGDLMPGYATGTGPQGLASDGPIYAHKGEIIYSKTDSDEIRKNGDTNNQNMTVNINVNGAQDPKATARETHREIQKLIKRYS